MRKVSEFENKNWQTQKVKKLRPRFISSVKMSFVVFFYSSPLVELVLRMAGGSVSKKISDAANNIKESEKSFYRKKLLP